MPSFGATVPTGGLPLDVGVVVMNVGTCAALARAVLRGKPLTHRVVTVSGAGIRQAEEPAGAGWRQLPAADRPLRRPDPRRGPRGGRRADDGLYHQPARYAGDQGDQRAHGPDPRRDPPCRGDGLRPLRTVCRCLPDQSGADARSHWPHGRAMRSIAERYHASACMECGCCAYECPASIPLVQLIRVGKVMLRNGAAC